MAVCVWFLPLYFIVGDDTDTKEDILYLGLFTIGLSGLVVTPFIIVYIVLLDAVDYDGWKGEIQSWMIGYIIWGIFTFILISMFLYGAVFARNKAEAQSLIFQKCIDWLLWIIGVQFNLKGAADIRDFGADVALFIVFVFPAVAAILPCAIVGFIANYVLEEKFELKCSEDITNDDLCFEDGGYGCCEVISSHDFINSYSFMGGLASNILATWAIIRIVGYIMVNTSPELSMFANKTK